MYKIIKKGITLLNASATPKVTLESLLVSIGAPKLRSYGFKIKKIIKNPELKLYDYLTDHLSADRAHSAYNSYIRRLVSFERALQCVKKRT